MGEVSLLLREIYINIAFDDITTRNAGRIQIMRYAVVLGVEPHAITIASIAFYCTSGNFRIDVILPSE